MITPKEKNTGKTNNKETGLPLGTRIYSSYDDEYYVICGEINENGIQLIVRMGNTEYLEHSMFDSIYHSVRPLSRKFGIGYYWDDITNHVYSPEEVDAQIEVAKEFDKVLEKREEEKRQAENKEIEGLRKAYDFLIENPTNDEKITKKNLTILLKKKFEGVKFSIRKKDWKNYCISWSADLTEKEVSKVADMFNAYSFDSYTDCLDYTPSLFNRLFGGFQYVWTEKI